MRRVYAIVSETFTARRVPLPAVTVVQAGSLPLTGVQVVLERLRWRRNPVEPVRAGFPLGESAASNDYTGAMAPLVQKSMEQLDGRCAWPGWTAKMFLRATCFVSSMDDIREARAWWRRGFRERP